MVDNVLDTLSTFTTFHPWYQTMNQKIGKQSVNRLLSLSLRKQGYDFGNNCCFNFFVNTYLLIFLC